MNIFQNMTNGSINGGFDLECLSATIIDHQKDHTTNLDLHSAVSLSSSIFRRINVETSESKVLSHIQKDILTPETLKSFIRKMWMLKDERKLSDETACSALSMLLPDVAAEWWETARPYVKSWNLAVALILKVLDEKRTLGHAWRELEHSSHQHDKHLKPFLNEQLILLAEIGHFKVPLTEQLKIDLVFHKLSPSIRKQINRNTFTTFHELLKLAKSYGLMESDPNSTGACKCCNHRSHTDDMCVDKKYEDYIAAQKERYGSSAIPSIAIKLNGIPEYVHLATDSQLNVITDQLYYKLVQRGCVFESSQQVVATIRSNKKNVLQMTTVIVECNDRLIITPVVKLQSSRGNKNCFGINFIESCSLLPYLKS